jgi:hypothetical protein
MRVVVAGVVTIPPFSAGCAWNRLQYVIGLLRLGHDAYLVEEVKPPWCSAGGRPCAYRDSDNRHAFASLLRQFDLAGHACQVYDGGAETTGLSYDELLAVARDADLLIDISGHVQTDSLLDSFRRGRRAYFDHDPVYTQLWRAEYGKDLRFAQYDVFLTVGLNIGTPHSPIPDCGIEWRRALPPVVPEFWARIGARAAPADGPFTTVASWGGYADLSFRGEWYRTKYDEFRHFADLPRRAGQPCEVLLKSVREHDDGVSLLREGGWVVRTAPGTLDLTAYRDYLARSRAEIGITKGAYAKGRSGWFSDRTASYLAGGRPALVQSTGFEWRLPTGAGLVTFMDAEEAVAGVESINRNYPAHCRAAREFAAAYLDYRKVLPGMLDACGSLPARAPVALPDLRGEPTVSSHERTAIGLTEEA